MIKKIKRKLNQLNVMLIRRFGYLKIRVKLDTEWYGSNYGGFFVCPELLNNDSIIYSFGIGEDISFDRTIIQNHDCTVFGFDPTPKSINWINSQNLPVKFHFLDFGISNKSGFIDFYLPKNPEYVSGSIICHDELNEKVIVQMKAFNDIIYELEHRRIDVLKMDIEGSEYDVIDDVLNAQVLIGQILIEFHDRFVENGRRKTQQAIKKLKTHGYEIFSISETLDEISFVNKKILK